jgi:small GTP-binding protein
MEDDFNYDVFLSHSSKDKDTVRAVAERLRADGLRVWLDDWELKPGDNIPSKIEEGLEHSHILILCMSANAFGSDWATLESQAFRFRDPLNKDRRFIPLRLDETEPKGSLAQFLYIDWLPDERAHSYPRLLEACRPPTELPVTEAEAAREQLAEKGLQLAHGAASINDYAFSPDGKRALSGSGDRSVRLWDLETGRCLRTFNGHTDLVQRVALSSDGRRAISGAEDGTVRVWDVETGDCLRVLEGHADSVLCVAWGSDQRHAISSGFDKTVRVWDVETGRCLRVLEGHTNQVWSVAWDSEQRHAVSGSCLDDCTVRVWDVETGRCLRVLEGHTATILAMALSSDGRRALSGSWDSTARVWDVETGRCLRVLEGHGLGGIWSVALTADQRRALSCGGDRTVRVWDVETGRCLRVLEGHMVGVQSVAWSADGHRAFSGDRGGGIRVWDLSEFVSEARTLVVSVPDLAVAPEQVEYTNAKVLLVGESGAGKTGLSKRLALGEWEPSDSTVGAWATQWKIDVDSEGGVEREIWLWDFGGQADQRLIHQLYMDETSLAVLVFDGQKDDVFETLGQWDRDLMRASNREFSKLLVAGRVDAGGLRVSKAQVEAFAKERGYTQFLETSAKQDICCEDLKRAILEGIQWENIPWRSTPLLFKRLKEEIVRLKDEGRVLMRFNELREALQLRLSGEFPRFTDEELKAVVGLLAGPGVVWELKFGSWVLLQPERINAYAQAVIQAMRADEGERGCLPEERVLSGDLTYQSSVGRLGADEERFVLLAMHQTLVERGLCLREHTDRGPLLIFPSYYRRERPELVGHPAVHVSYRFNGFLDDIYATLVVRLHHTRPFQQDQLWRYAADFKTLTEKQLGVKMTRRSEGAGELEVYFDPAIEVGEKIIFSKYVHEHLLQNARDVVRLRHYVCPHCGTPVGNREVAMRRLDVWLEKRPADAGVGGWLSAKLGKTDAPTIICSDCEKRVPLWDELEQSFASPETKQRVRELQEESAVVLDSESRERALVGEVISTVALAGQISREFNVSDHGLDMEIEFKSDEGEATGKRLYLHVKSGDSLRTVPGGHETGVFIIKDEANALYWMRQPSPVLIVVRNASGEVRWMEVREYLKGASEGGVKPVRQIAFEGERFDVMSVRRWRDRLLSEARQ